MRDLTKQQKKELTKWFNKNYNGGYMFNMADKIDYDTYEKIEELHPTKIHYQNVNHFLAELVNF